MSHEMASEERQMDAYCTKLEAENERLRGLLGEAADDIEHWGGYASEYFKDKWHLDDDIKKYREAAGAAVQPNGATWQPIETAPKQRKIIVHYLNEAEKHRTVMACYYGEKSLEMHDDYDDVGTWDEESGTLFADAGWYEEHDSDNPILPLGGVPTHWMQLPEPPATTDPTDAAP